MRLTCRNCGSQFLVPLSLDLFPDPNLCPACKPVSASGPNPDAVGPTATSASGSRPSKPSKKPAAKKRRKPKE